jgi:hypothetical protein
MKIKLTATFATLLASTVGATLIASPVIAKSKHKSIDHRTALVHRHDVASDSFASAIRAHSPNPAWDVYNHEGRYVGSDPDPRIREMILIQSGFKPD